MRFLKQNTATRVTVGPFFDKTDGITPETALTVTNEKLTFMVDDGGVPTLVLDTAPTASGGDNDMVHVTNDDAGFYDLELTAANVNYVGRAMLALTDAANHCPVFHEFMIVPANVYDSLFGTDKLQVDAVEVSGDSTAADNLETACDGGSYNVGGGAVVAASVTAAVTLANGAHGGASAVITLQTPIVANTTQIEGADATDAITTAATAATPTVTAATVSDKTGYTLDSDYDAAKTAAQAGDEMDLVNAPNSTAVTAIQSGLAGATELATVDTVVDAIKAKTDNLPADPAGVSDIPDADDLADAVWDEPIAGHGTPLSTGAALAGAGSAGDPWSTALPGAYGPGTAGAMMADVSTQAALIPAAGPPSAEHYTAARAAKLDDIGGAVASVTAPVTVDSASVAALRSTLVGIVGLSHFRKG